MTPRTPPGRHPAGRTLSGSGANRGHGCAALFVASFGVVCFVLMVGAQIGRLVVPG